MAISQIAILTGSSLSPSVELPVAGMPASINGPFREWVSALPDRIWDAQRRMWVVYGFGPDTDPDAMLARFNFTAVGPDGDPTQLRTLVRPIAIPSPQDPSWALVYPRLAGRAAVAGHVGPDAAWQTQNRCFLTRGVVFTDKSFAWCQVDPRLVQAVTGSTAALVSTEALLHGAGLRPVQPSLVPATPPVPVALPTVPAVPVLSYDGTVDGLRGVPLVDLKSVEASVAASMLGLGISNIYELLHHVPRDYIDMSNPIPISQVEVGKVVAIVGKVTKTSNDSARSMTKATVRDTAGDYVSATWFNAPWVHRKLNVGATVLLHGKMTTYLSKAGNSGLSMTNPLVDQVTADEQKGLIGIYPASGKHEVTSWMLHHACKEAAGRIGNLADPVPESLLKIHGLPGRGDAFRMVHDPKSRDDGELGHDRLAYDELLRLQLALLIAREAQHAEPAVVHTPTGHLTGQMLAALPFSLTGAQTRTTAEILSDMSSPIAMHRLLQGDVGSGKAQPLDSLVLTPSGFVRMGDVNVGDTVVAATGHHSRVLGVFPQGDRQVYKVSLSDGTSVRADGNHLWSVATTTMRHRWKEPRIMTTLELLADLCEKNGASKYHIEAPEPVDLDDGGQRPIDGYLLGSLLGDGSLGSEGVNITTGDDQTANLIREVLPEGMSLTVAEGRPGVKVLRPICQKPEVVPAFEWDMPKVLEWLSAGATTVQIAAATGTAVQHVRVAIKKAGQSASRPNYLKDSLRAMGLVGKLSADKFVPKAYLNAPVEVRHAVLQGLLDTDGTLDYRTGSNVTFSTISLQLAQDVAWLVRSLGGLANVRLRDRKSGESQHVRITLPIDYEPFRLDRKRKHVHARTKYAYPARAITSIVPDGIEPTQCILIDHPSHLYVTDNFTTTHNTAVSLLAMLAALESGHQAALIAPTEILAAQHYNEIIKLLGNVTDKEGNPVEAVLLTNKVTGKDRKQVVADLASGKAGLVVGTHAVFADKVVFASLGLVIIDEQHRFGSEQRRIMLDKGALRPDGTRALPDILYATATPVPRTAMMTVFGDLDVSILDEKPAGRTPIKTVHVQAEDGKVEDVNAPVWAHVRAEVAAGRQAFVLCPLRDSMTAEAAGATFTAELLEQTSLTGLRIAVVTGKQPADERREVMGRFERGELDVLVATTVIEVGVNVPNATVMVVLDADRFGLAQLHQVRGRVGRGQFPGFCYLVATPRTSDGEERLAALVASDDGFALAERDLEIRGAGQLLGSTQSGTTRDLKVANILTDVAILTWAKKDATLIIAEDKKLARRPQLRAEIDTALGEDAAAWLTSA